MTVDREALVTGNMRLVHYICRRYFRNHYTSKLYEYEDLAGAGMIGLVKAANRYALERGSNFSTYAFRVILNELRRFVRDSSPIGGIKVSNGYRVECDSYHALAFEDTTFEESFGADQDFSAAEAKEFIAGLGDMERAVCVFLAGGYTQREIAARLATNQTYVSRWKKAVKAKYAKYAAGGR